MNPIILRSLFLVLILVICFLGLAHQINLLSNYNITNKRLQATKNELETKRDTIVRVAAQDLVREIEIKRDKKEIVQTFASDAVKISELGDVLVEKQKQDQLQKETPRITTIIAR
jgi:hypothetical protein